MPKSFVPPEQYYAGLARVRQGAGALITTPDGRVVMYDVTYRDYLELPGGAVEVRSGGYSYWIIRPMEGTGATRSCSSTTEASSTE